MATQLFHSSGPLIFFYPIFLNSHAGDHKKNVESAWNAYNISKKAIEVNETTSIKTTQTKNSTILLVQNNTKCQRSTFRRLLTKEVVDVEKQW